MNSSCDPVDRNRPITLPSLWRFRKCLIVKFPALFGMILLSSVFINAQSLGSYGKDFFGAAVSPETILMPASSAAFSNYISKPAGFGSGAEGFGYHYGVSLADNVNGKFMRKFVFAAASRQREQYNPLGGGNSILKRIGHAAIHSLFVSSDNNSSRAFNWSGLPASLAAAGLSNAYQPAEQRSWSATFARFGTTAGSYIAGDIWLEFTVKPRQNRLFRTFLKSR